MGCCASTAHPPSSESDSPQGTSKDAPQVPVNPPPNTNAAIQAPLPSSNGSSRPAHNSAVREVEPTVQTRYPAHPGPLPDARDTAQVPQPPPLAVPAPPSAHNGRALVALPVQPNIQTSSSQLHEHDRTRRAPSAYCSGPLKKSMSTQPLSQSALPASSSHTITRTMSASGLAPGDGSRNKPRRRPSTNLRTNQAQVADGEDNQRFTSTLRTVLSSQKRFRILVVGKRHSGKSSLVDSIFKVNMPRTPRTVDINAEYAPSENRHLIVHEFSSFESGVVQVLPIVRDFIMRRTHANCPASERLHAVWICVPTSDVIDGKLGDGVEDILKMNKVVPIVVVATKFDLAITQALFDCAGGDARTAAYERYDRSRRSLFHGNRDVSVEIVSTKPRSGDLITKLITTTHKRITADPRNATMPPGTRGTSQIAPVPLVYSIAQRVSQDLIIQACIDVGRSRYWRGLWSSQDFTDKIFEDCVDVVHTDIVKVWSLRDDVEYLLSKSFKTKMYSIVEDLTELHIGSPSSPMPERQASTSKVRWTPGSYQNSIENVRFMMGYIVDLTVILHGFFVSARDVSASKVNEAMDRHLQSRLREDIHQDIRSFVTEQAPFTYRGKDLVMEKIIDLIRQFCEPKPNT